jgi:hypothetical protein
MEVSISKQRSFLQWVAADFLPEDTTLRKKVKQRSIRIWWRGKEGDVPQSRLTMRLNADHFAVHDIPDLSIVRGSKASSHHLMLLQSSHQAFHPPSTRLHGIIIFAWTGNLSETFLSFNNWLASKRKLLQDSTRNLESSIHILWYHFTLLKAIIETVPPCGKATGECKLITHLHLVPRSKKRSYTSAPHMS